MDCFKLLISELVSRVGMSITLTSRNKICELLTGVQTSTLPILVDAPFSTITYTHFLEYRIRHTLAMPFYEAEPRSGEVIDAEGNRRAVPALVRKSVA